MTFKRFSKVKSLSPSYGPLEATQLLFETFFDLTQCFWDIWVGPLKWDTLYISDIAFSSYMYSGRCDGI